MDRPQCLWYFVTAENSSFLECFFFSLARISISYGQKAKQNGIFVEKFSFFRDTLIRLSSIPTISRYSYSIDLNDQFFNALQIWSITSLQAKIDVWLNAQYKGHQPRENVKKVKYTFELLKRGNEPLQKIRSLRM